MPRPYFHVPRALGRPVPPAPSLTVEDGVVTAQARASFPPRLSVDDAAVTAEVQN
jgi:hypothetical protein